MTTTDRTATICDTRDAARRIIGTATDMTCRVKDRRNLAKVVDWLQEALADAMAMAGLTVEQVEVIERRAVGVLLKLDAED